MQLLKTHKYQSNLAQYCRSGNYISIPGVNEKRVDRYRNLIYSIVDDSLQSAFPLTYDLLEKHEWNNMVDNFFSSHKCQSPLVWKMPKELPNYLQEANYPLLHKYPQLKDLLLLEWFEVEIYMMEDKEVEIHVTTGTLSTDNFVINPELTIIPLSYPVHLKNASNITDKDAGQYFVSLHREPKTGKVLFTDIKYPHLEILEKLANEKADFKALLEIFKKYASEENAIIALRQFLKAALNSKLILGFTK
ncbi:MAG: putative DNA-binding domain-containing protein [Bacteroidales bacterium]|nr:putative DNA-binding domain-containing protein [Bacteroidales bacterium]